MKKLFVQHRLLFTLLLFLLTSIISIYVTDLSNNHIWSYLDVYTDGRFHIMRIQGLYESIKQGSLFPIVNMSFLDGFGYISNIFYSNLWLYPAAILRLLGLPMASSFVIYYIILNFCTFLTSFWSFHQVSKNYSKSLVFSFVYTLSTYRIFDMVRRFDVGETLTLVFLPIIVLGVYEIFYVDENKWLYLALGMTGVIYSHALSPILIATFIILVALFRIKKLFKEPKRILKLFYAGLLSLILSLNYFLPIIEQLKHTQFKLTSPSIDIAQTSLSLKKLLFWSMTNNMYSQNIGLILILVALTIPFIIWKIKIPAIRDFAIIAEILLVMTTNIFPWKLFENTPLKMIQFPWRFNMIITILLAIVLASDELNIFNKNWKKSMLILLTIISTMSSEYILVNNNPGEYNSYKSFDNLDSYSIGSGQEYLPQRANLTILRKTSHRPQIKSGTAVIKNFKKHGSSLSFNFENARNTIINVPIIAYYGYSAKDSVGQVSELKMDQTDNGLGKVKVNGNGIVRINYYQTPIQIISRIISGLSAVLLVIILIFKKKVWKKVYLKERSN